MTRQIRDRTLANLDVALEEACRDFPNGGDHEQRKFVAQRLKASARKGVETLGELRAVASAAVAELLRRGGSSKTGA
jgi:ribosomal 50S subunit-associated protein YjgA (DUF615 family)